MRVRLSALALATALACAPGSALAQFAWDGPSLVGPHAPAGLSVLLVANDPGGALGAMAQWRQDRASLGWGYRGGIVQSDHDDLALFGGVDVSAVLAESVEDADIRVLWWSGVGAGVGSELAVSIPVGLVAGWSGMGDGNAFAPYAGAHVALDVATGDGDNLSLDASLDLGLDLTLTSGWVVRFGASLFGRDAVGVGIRVPS
ncbi:MAG TPA: hypothetical protein VLH75_14590 [Longimicrobiales bacterium]|nr:hypothetical protein [Longimicrobiales bacterium]